MSSRSKKEKIILVGLSFFSLAAIAPVTLINSVKNINNFEQTIKSTLDNKTRQITDNIGAPDSIKNPDEVFYLSENLRNLDVWNSSTNSENTNNKKKFEDLDKNISNIAGDSEIKTSLLEIKKDVYKYLEYKKIEAKWQNDSDLSDVMSWEEIKDIIKQNLDNPAETFDQISTIEPEIIKENLSRISGLTNENAAVNTINNLTGKATAPTKNDLLSAQAGTQPPFVKTVSSVAGTGYNSLIKVAEIDLQEQNNYVLEYSYRETTTSTDAKSYLIIKNDKGQIREAETLNKAYQSLDIFGRYDQLGSGNQIGVSSFKTEQENIVLRKTDDNNKLEVMVRLKKDESITKMNFSAEYGQPIKFGILDVQADQSSTFRSLINSMENNGGSQTSTQLMNPANPTTNTDNQLVKIQFFTSEFVTKRIPAKPFSTRDDVSPEPNRTLEVYQGYDEDYTFSMDLNYITRFATDNTGNDYEPIKQYVAGVATNKVESLDLKFDGKNGSVANDGKSTYNFFDLLKQNMAAEVKDAFPDISTIKVNSSVKNGVAKQTITYSDQFYLIGNPSTKVGVDTSKEIKMKIPNMLDKIFVEKPNVYDQNPAAPSPFSLKNKNQSVLDDTNVNPEVDSEIKATEQIDEKVNVIKTLAQVYDKWNQNDASFNNVKHNLSVSKIKFTPSGSTFKDISIVRETISKTGYEIYNDLNQYWPGIAGLIQKIFNPDFINNSGRFLISASNSAQSIIDKFFVNNFEFIPNYAQVDQIIKEAITAWNEDPFFVTNTDGSIPSLNQLSAETQKKFAEFLARLVEIQFDAIIKEFESNQMFPLYKEFSGILASNETAARLTINDTSALLEQNLVTGGGPNLIKYKEGAWDNISKIENITVKTQLLSLIKLLAFGKTDDDLTNLADGILTNPLIALKFKEFDPDNFVNFEDSQSINTKLNQMRILDGILSYFGYSFSESYVDFINNPTSGPLRLVFKLNGKTTNLTFSQVLEDIIQKLDQKGNEYKPTANEFYSSYWLDNIIAGTNVIRSMNWKLKQLNGAIPSNQFIINRETQQEWEAKDVVAKINDILAQQQASPAEQAAWYSAMTNGSKDFDAFASAFSGRTNNDLEKIFNELTKDSVIMARRTIDYNDGFLASLTEALKYVWFILVALIGVGVMSASIVGVTNRSRQEKLSAHPIIKWLLFSLIGLGALVTILALAFGIPTVL